MLDLRALRAAARMPRPKRPPGISEPSSIVSDPCPSSRRCGEVLEALEGVIASRKSDPSARSYTTKLLASGPAGAGTKVVEEADELVRAAAGETDDRVVAEAADLVYHTLVLLACRDVSLARVEAELARRFGVSGLDEKAARTAGDTGGSR